MPHILQGVVAPNARKAHGYRHSRREAQEKACKLTDGGGLSESCPDEAVDPIATPLPQSFDPLPLPKQICPADIGQHTIFDLGGCPCGSFPPLSPGYPKRKLGNKPARTRQKAIAVCMQICPSPKNGRSFSSPAIRPHQNREP